MSYKILDLSEGRYLQTQDCAFNKIDMVFETIDEANENLENLIRASNSVAKKYTYINPIKKEYFEIVESEEPPNVAIPIFEDLF